MIENTASQASLPGKFAQPPSEAVIIIDGSSVIQFATPDTALFYGYDLDQVIGHSILRFIAPEDHPKAIELWESLQADPDRSTGDLNTWVITAEGRRIPTHASIWELPGRNEFLVLHHIDERLRDRLQTLYAIQAAVAQTLDIDSLLETVLQELPRLIPCPTSTIFIVGDGATIQVRRWHEDAIERFRAPLKSHQPEFETRRIIRETNRPLIIHDTEKDPRWVTLPNHRPIRSWLGAPLNHHGKYLGEINLDSPEPNQFTEGDAELVHALANQVATVVYHAQLYEEEQRRAARYQVLNEISQAISQLDLGSVLELVYQNISRLMDTSTFFIALLDAEAHQVKIVGSYDFGVRRPDEIHSADIGITGRVLRTREPLIIHDSSTDPLPEQTIVQDEMPASILMMPLITQDDIVGVISVQSYEPHAYSKDDVALLETVAGAVATAVRNAQLYDQTAERLHALETLHQMSLDLAAVQDPQAVARLVVRAASKLFAPDEARLVLTPGHSWEVTTWIAYPSTDGMLASDQMQAQLRDLVEQVQQARQPLILPDLNCSPDYQPLFDCDWPVQAAVLCPIRRSGAAFGVIVLLYREPHFFRRDMQRPLDLLCLQAGTAFENARHTIKMQRSLAEVSALHELARSVSAMDSTGDILNAVVEAVRDIFQSYSASIALYDEVSGEVVTLAASGLSPEHIAAARFKYGEYVAGEVVATGRVIYVPDTHNDSRFRVIDPAVRSLMVVPLTVHGRTIGSLGIDSAEPNAFTRDHERILMIAGGQIAAAIETVRLLEETRRRADDLAAANRQLEAQDRLREDMVYQVSHDLRSPLQIVYGYADMMQTGDLGPVTDDQRDVLDLIMRRSKSIERMTEDIMAVTPINRSTLVLAPLNLTEVCAQVIDSARVVYQEREDLVFAAELPSYEVIVEADYNRLLRVLDNLIGNAVKFSPRGGTITVRVTRDEANRQALVAVSDEGIGIPADQLPYVFERFYRGHRMQFEGSGLGLYNVQQIIQAHRGDVWVESQEGQGTTFAFTLPLTER